MFFQAALLAGYAYADWSVRRWGARRQAAVHLAVLLVPALTLPIGLPDGWSPPGEGEPAWWLLGALALGVGLPFFALSTGAPVLQRWFAELPHPRAADPYFLYRASNVGSFLGLLAYPLLLEPMLGLRAQAWLWSAGYVLWAGLVALCAVAVHRGGGQTPPPDVTPSGPASAPTLRDYLRWVALAFIPSSLLLGVTTTLTVDLAPIPLLWVVPLGIYLLTFVLAFSMGRLAGTGRWLAQRAYPLLAVLVLGFLLLAVRRPLWLVTVIHLATFAAAGLVCHGRLADERPHPHFLTRFYLCLAGGGALGGVVNSLVAPTVFNSLLEYPIAVLLVFLALPRRAADATGRWASLRRVVPPVIGIALAVTVLVGPLRDELAVDTLAAVLGVCALLATLALLSRPALAGAIAAVAFAGATVAGWSDSDALLRDRNFYGTLQVAETDDGRYRTLLHGTTIHGAQPVGGDTRQPTTYYHPAGPLGDVVRTARSEGRLATAAVVGLGTGTTACLAEAGERMTFYEINPLVVRIARNPELFTYLRDCPGEHDVVLGDARLSLAQTPAGAYDLVVLDAFTSDAIPVHLLTREAFALYAGRLSETGAIAVHVSNRYADLEPVVGRIAAEAGMSCLIRTDAGGGGRYERTSSKWVALARAPADLAGLRQEPGWAQCRAAAPLWTDDYANLFGTLRLG